MLPAANDAEFRQFAGTVVWPTTPELLTDLTKCPACFAPLTDLVCRSCGLSLGHPAAMELAELSKTASDTLSQRVNVIGRMRHETSEAKAPAATTAPIPESVSVPVPKTVPTTAGAETTAGARPVAEPSPQVPAASPGPEPTAVRDGRPRRSSVQIALLVAGVSLLSIFAIYFLVYAFINYGIVWRSVIIASVTVAAFVSASLLRRRALTASAEGIAVFAIVLVYLDAYAIRANDFFGSGSADAAVYWGATLTLASVAFIGWHRLSNVRAASIVGWASLAPGVGTLVWGLTDGLEPASRVFAAVIAATLATLSHVVIPRAGFAGTLERMLVLVTGVAALSVAFLVSWAVDPSTDWGGSAAALAVVLVAFGHAALGSVAKVGTVTTRAFGHAFAVIGGVAAASAASIAAVRVALDDIGFAIFVPVVAATVVTLALEFSARRAAPLVLRQPLAFAAWGSLAVLGMTALLPLGAAALPVGAGLAGAVGYPWTADATLSLALGDANSGIAVLALACVVALASAFWLLTGSARRHGPALAWAGAVVVILAAAQLPSVWLALAGWLLLAVAALAVLMRTHDAALLLAYRACLTAVVATSTTLLFFIGWASIDTWATTTGATIVVLLACRAVVRTAEGRAILLGGATVLVLAAAIAVTRHLTWENPLLPVAEAANAASVVGLTAALLLGLAAVGYRRFVSDLDRRTVFWIAGAAAGGAAFTVSSALPDSVNRGSLLLLPQFSTSLVSALLLFAALALWVALRANATHRPERIAASIALAPALFWVVDSFARVLGLTGFAHAVVPISAAMLAAAGALTVTLLRPSTAPRWAREAGVALVGVPAVVGALTRDSDAGWLVLVLAAVTLLLTSISSDGLFASGSARRHLGWLALALATAGLWWRLSSDRVEALEPYVLPLAAALVSIAYLIHRATAKQQANENTDAPSSSKAAPLVALAGLLVGLLPLALNSLTGEVTRPLVIFGVSALLLLAGSLVVRGRAVQPYLDAAALAGAVGVLVTGFGRAFLASSNDLVPDAWVLALFVVLIAAGFGQARSRVRDGGVLWRERASQGLAAVAIIALAGIEAQGFTDNDLGSTRAIATVAGLSALHVIAYAIDTAPLTRSIFTLAIALAGGLVVVGLATDALDFVELGTVPVAIALIVTGRMRLAAEPETRSWRPLAPGILVLLVPSLFATAGAPELWRLVGLGVVAVAVLIVGAVRRLQAPFLLGLAVALIHGFSTFAPQIRAVYESQEWWLWAGLAGVVLVLLAIRYEKRIQNLRDVVMKITSLR